MASISTIGFQQAFILIKETLHSRMIDVEVRILEPVDVKGFTEICRLEGEKRAMKREMTFLRNVIETMEKAL